MIYCIKIHAVSRGALTDSVFSLQEKHVSTLNLKVLLFLCKTAGIKVLVMHYSAKLTLE